MSSIVVDAVITVQIFGACQTEMTVFVIFYDHVRT